MSAKERKTQKTKRSIGHHQTTRTKADFILLLKAIEVVEFKAQENSFWRSVAQNSGQTLLEEQKESFVEEGVDESEEVNGRSSGTGSEAWEGQSQTGESKGMQNILSINPRNPIRDAGKSSLLLSIAAVQTSVVTKKRLRICGNRLCGFEGFGSEGTTWSRKKVAGQLCWFCKTCSEAFNNNQFCDFCKQVYITAEDSSANNDGKEWIQCQQCSKWVHTDCEVSHGNLDLQKVTDDTVYYCLTCRKSKKTKKEASPSRTHTSALEESTAAGKDASAKKEDLSHDLEEGHIEKYPTTESMCESQSTSEKLGYEEKGPANKQQSSQNQKQLTAQKGFAALSKTLPKSKAKQAYKQDLKLAKLITKSTDTAFLRNPKLTPVRSTDKKMTQARSTPVHLKPLQPTLGKRKLSV